MQQEEIFVDYRVRVTQAALAARVESLLLEQTVELPRAALRPERVRGPLVGRVVASEGLSDGRFRVTLAQPAAAAAGDPAQLLNLLFGNCSLQPDIELDDVRVPESLASRLGGPRFGAEGIRRTTGVRGRALTASAIKPMGVSAGEAAALCGAFALAGLDIIKDDHGLADHAGCPFADRVRACLEATLRAAQTTGRRAVYAPNLIGEPSAVMRQAALAADLGAQAVLVSPMLVGLPFFNELVRSLGVPVLAHPAFGGAARMAPEALLGRLFPLFGADAVIFPNAGGRFAYGRETCAAIAANLRTPSAGHAPSLPVPAGGIKAENASAVLDFYGIDTILLVGGSLLETPDSASLTERSRRFVEDVRAYVPKH